VITQLNFHVTLAKITGIIMYTHLKETHRNEHNKRVALQRNVMILYIALTLSHLSSALAYRFRSNSFLYKNGGKV
jgi:hypothetical protein